MVGAKKTPLYIAPVTAKADRSSVFPLIDVELSYDAGGSSYTLCRTNVVSSENTETAMTYAFLDAAGNAFAVKTQWRKRSNMFGNVESGASVEMSVASEEVLRRWALELVKGPSSDEAKAQLAEGKRARAVVRYNAKQSPERGEALVVALNIAIE